MSLPSRVRHPWFAPPVLVWVLVLTAAASAPAALARVAVNTIDPVATLSERSRQLTLTGPLEVTAGETIYLHVTLTQRSTGAIAEGIAFLTGTGARQQWTVRTTTLTRERFEEGPATAVAVARTTLRGVATDSHQWLVNVTVVRE